MYLEAYSNSPQAIRKILLAHMHQNYHRRSAKGVSSKNFKTYIIVSYQHSRNDTTN